MNEKFLALKAAKIVILAGIEKLDRDLTIAHMQGKFQLEALPKHGHLIQVHDEHVMSSDTLTSHLTQKLLSCTMCRRGILHITADETDLQ